MDILKTMFLAVLGLALAGAAAVIGLVLWATPIILVVIIVYYTWQWLAG